MSVLSEWLIKLRNITLLHKIANILITRHFKYYVTLHMMSRCHFTEPDCTRCNYTVGQIWLSDSTNCHDYYICEKVDTWGKTWYWIPHHVSCGLLYWDQSRLTCTTMIQPGCTDQTGVTIVHPSTTEGNARAVVCKDRHHTFICTA